MKFFIITLIILVIILLMIIILIGQFLAYNNVLKRKIPDNSLLKGYDYNNIEFEIRNGKVLRGWFIKSPDNLDNKVLILLHGWQRNRTRIVNHAKLFVNNGFHVVLYDQRSHGASDNALITFGKEESEDLLCCINYLQKNKDINIEKLGALGFSLGCGGVIYAASSQNKAIFKAIVLEGAFAKSYDTGKFMLQKRFGRITGYLIGQLFFTLGTKIASFGKFHHSEPYKFIGKIPSTPIMVIRGENDYMVPKKSSVKLIDSIRGEKEIWYNKIGNHTDALETCPNEYKERVIGFLNKYLG